MRCVRLVLFARDPFCFWVFSPRPEKLSEAGISSVQEGELAREAGRCEGGVAEGSRMPALRDRDPTPHFPFQTQRTGGGRSLAGWSPTPHWAEPNWDWVGPDHTLGRCQSLVGGAISHTGRSQAWWVGPAPTLGGARPGWVGPDPGWVELGPGTGLAHFTHETSVCSSPDFTDKVIVGTGEKRGARDSSPEALCQSMSDAPVTSARGFLS